VGSKPVSFALFQSADTKFDSSDKQLGALKTVNPSPINPQSLGVIQLTRPVVRDPSRPYLLIVADPFNRIPADPKANNVFAIVPPIPELVPSRGQLTFDAEGSNDPKSPYYSLRPSVPSDYSGLTIGRGYDLSQRTKAGALADLTAAGLPKDQAQAYAGAAGLGGQKARDYLNANTKALSMITLTQQWNLFESVYGGKAADAKRISDDPTNVHQFGQVDWSKLNPVIWDVVVDMTFRGDYTTATRKLMQKYVANNDLKGFTGVMSDRSSWSSVPSDRFNRRVAYLNEALAMQTYS
jgi:hypothetical protein